MALKNNHRRPASRYAVEMAEAQHRQALAGYWPQVTAKGGFTRMDEPTNFLFPAKSFNVPATTVTVATPMGPMPITTPAQEMQIPEQDVKIMDRDTYFASVEATWLLYDGGMRKGYREQAKSLVDMMKQESRRTDLEIVDSVTRLYYGAVLAAQLHSIAKDTLERMEATLNLTETMYKEGSGRVKKTDFLGNKVMVESLRSMVALLEKNALIARAALANTMGLPWNDSVTPAETAMPFTPFPDNLEHLVSSAYRFNPDWAKIEAGISAAQGAIRTAVSEHYPKLALTGELHKWWNDYNTGAVTDENKEGWSVGIGIEIPIFSGFLTQNKVSEAKARLAKIKEEQLLFKEGIGLQIRDTFLSLNAAEKSYQATLEAMNAAVENRDLNTRAYRHELVETEDVIRAQLMESFMAAQHYKTRYDHLALRSRLKLLVGTEIQHKLIRQ
ncbi:TolC family protein [Syntrophotalea carbinolica]